MVLAHITSVDFPTLSYALLGGFVLGYTTSTVLTRSQTLRCLAAAARRWVRPR